jgi:hypothetical protein
MELRNLLKDGEEMQKGKQKKPHVVEQEKTY